MSVARTLSVGLVYDDSLDRHGGVAQHVLLLARELRRRGHRVALLAGESVSREIDGAPVLSLSRNVTVSFHGNRLSTPLPARAAGVRRALRAHRFDVLHVQMPYSPLMAGRVLARADAHTALVGTFHIASERLLLRLGTRALGLACHRTLRCFDRTIAVSHIAAAFARRLLGDRPTVVVPNMVDLAWFRAIRAEPGGDGGDPHVVFVGSLVARKGVDRLLRAFAALRDEHPAAALTIAGDGPWRSRLERLARRLELRSVRFEGAVDEARKRTLLAGADVACFPSRYGESFGVVLLEAMAAGAGVVLGGRNPGYAELLEGRAEALVDPDDPHAFAAALRAAAGDQALRASLHAWQQQLVTRYDAGAVVDRVLAVYGEALAAAHMRSGG